MPVSWMLPIFKAIPDRPATKITLVSAWLRFLLVDAQVDYSKNRNQALTSVIFVAGLSGIALKIGSIQLTGMVLACVVGMVMSLVIYLLDRAHLTNDQD